MRPAFTLAELVVALAIGGMVFGTFAGVIAQQERAHARLSHRIRARAQATEGSTTLVLELRGLSPTEGDIIAAQDSAIELRSTVANLTICEIRGNAIVSAHGSFASGPKAGDTAWIYVPDDSAVWVRLGVATVAMLPPDAPVTCAGAARAPGSSSRTRLPPDRYLIGFTEPPPVQPGTPVRLTRGVRYSLYRAPDRQWYLGRREWSALLGRFETIQPLSGPFRGYAPVGSGVSGVELRYFDAAGEEVGAVTDGIAKIDVTMRTPPPASDPAMRVRRDVTSITVAPGIQP